MIYFQEKKIKSIFYTYTIYKKVKDIKIKISETHEILKIKSTRRVNNQISS